MPARTLPRFPQASQLPKWVMGCPDLPRPQPSSEARRFVGAPFFARLLRGKWRFWVAQRFSAVIKHFSHVNALAPEAAESEFFRKLFSLNTGIHNRVTFSRFRHLMRRSN
jgi:hypothetical protein